MKITMSHGSGGKATSELISSIFAKHFGNDILGRMEDAAIVKAGARIAMTTDSFVVTPIFFKGGNIGKLCVCGTVNDLLMSGAVPKYLTAGFIIEEGVEFDTLEKISESLSKAAEEAGVLIVAGDTKVIEGNGGIYINTSGVGIVPAGRSLGCSYIKAGDAIILSGNIGDHHATILSARMGIENNIKSDCAPLVEPVNSLFKNNIHVRTMRDVTRGGLATVLNEISDASGLGIEIFEDEIPVSHDVGGLCSLLGLDPLYMANEGKFIVIADKKDADSAIHAMRQAKYGENAVIIGNVVPDHGVTLNTKIGGKRKIDIMYGEGLPRIC